MIWGARKVVSMLLAAGSLMMASQAAMSAAVVGCTANDCTWSMLVDGQDIQNGSGVFVSNPDGTLSLPAPVKINLPDGGFISLDGIHGQLDPVLGFNASAGTTAGGHTFAFSFSLPISLSGPLVASSSLGYALTSTTAAGAQIAPLFGSKVLIAQDVDTTVGSPLGPLDKGVNVGNTFFFIGGPMTQTAVDTANSSLTGNLAYDLMSVTLAFSLSANSNVGLSGFVQQEVDPVPEPSSWMLVAAGGVLFVFGLRKQQALL
jgi:hypothetical protein